LPFHFQPFVAQVRPTLAALPNYSSELTKPAQSAISLTYAKSDIVNQVRPDLSTLPNFSSTFATPAQTIIKLTFAKSDIVSQVRPTLATLPSSTATNLSPESISSKPRRFATGDILTEPTRLSLIVVINPITLLPGRYQSERPPFYKGKYEVSDFVNQVRPTLATLSIFGWNLSTPNFFRSRYFSRSVADVSPAVPPATITIVDWFGNIGQVSLPRGYTVSDFIEPPKLDLTTALLSEWGSTDGQKSVLRSAQQYTDPDFIKPVLLPSATPNVSGWYPTLGLVSISNGANYPKSSLDFVISILPTISISGLLTVTGQNSIVLDYLQGDYFGVLFVTSLAKISGWLVTDGQKAVVSEYALPNWDAPAKFGLVATATPTVANWFGTDGKLVVELQYAFTDWIAPAISPITISYAWRGEDPYFPKFDWYSMGDTSTGPSTTATAQQAYAQETLGQNSLTRVYASASWVAPDKLGLAVIGVSTVASWATTNGLCATILKYTISDFTNQIRPTLSTLSSGTSFLDFVALKAQPQRFAVSNWSAPDKFGIITPAAITLSNWISTLGQKAVVLKYAFPDFINQVKATLATLPTLLFGISEIASNSQPKKFAVSDWSAPSKFGLVAAVPATLAGWTSTLGQNSVVLKYASSDYVNRIRPTLATLPILLYGMSELGPNAQPQKFSTITFDKSIFTTPASVVTSSVASWFSPLAGSFFSRGYSSAVEDVRITAPLSITPVSISVLSRGMVFYRVATANMDVNTKVVGTFVVNGVVVQIVTVE